MTKLATITNNSNGLSKTINISSYSHAKEDKLYRFYSKSTNFSIQIKYK